MKRFIEGEVRSQSTLFPEHLGDYIAEDNPVRVIDVFVDELDLQALGFEGMQPEVTGRPAYHNRDKNFTDRKLKARMQQLDESIARYMSEVDRADREPALVTEARVEHIKEKVATVKKQMRKLKQIGKQMSQAPDGQISLTDPDARSMATSGRGTGMVGYNVQSAVDAKHHMIVAHEVTNVGHDREQLFPMAHQTRDAIGEDELTVLADRGYFKGQQILDCEQAGIKTFL
jgi:Transposase DDE domain